MDKHHVSFTTPGFLARLASAGSDGSSIHHVPVAKTTFFFSPRPVRGPVPGNRRATWSNGWKRPRKRAQNIRVTRTELSCHINNPWSCQTVKVGASVLGRRHGGNERSAWATRDDANPSSISALFEDATSDHTCLARAARTHPWGNFGDDWNRNILSCKAWGKEAMMAPWRWQRGAMSDEAARACQPA
ncbi:hypothetical protein SEVIR_9G330050v4 [Setaria viridis]